MLNISCDVCGKTFHRKPSAIGDKNYCSQKCVGESQRGLRPNSSRITVYCANCKKPKEVYPSLIDGRQFFCGYQCKYDYGKGVGDVEKICEICDKAYTVNQFFVTTRKSRFCSVACQAVGHSRSYTAKNNPLWVDRITVACAECGAQFESLASLKRKVCSRKCYYAYQSKTYRRDNHWHWKGGAEIDYGPDWLSIARDVRKRDNWMCAACHKFNKGIEKDDTVLHVHHIRPLREFNGDYESANQFSNLISLCHSCHRRVETGNIPCPMPQT